MPRLDLFKPTLVDGRPGISSYRGLLDALARDRVTATHADDAAGLVEGRRLLLRHDVDSNLVSALRQARLEAELGMPATFYVLHPGDGPLANYYGRIVDGRIEHEPAFVDAIHEMRSLGHEVGLHYDLLQLSEHTGREPVDLLQEELAWFESIGAPLRGAASHGSAFARQHGIVNYEVFREAAALRRPPRTVEINGRVWDLPLFGLDDVGLEYEAYQLPRDSYVTDSGAKFHVTPDFLTTVELDDVAARVAEAERVVALLHPEWWRPLPTAERSVSAGVRRAKPSIESVPSFSRADGGPVRIGVRGDCCCRRAVHMNAALFPDGYDMSVNEKCTNAQYVETLSGRTVSDDELSGLSDLDRMSPSLRAYYTGQNDRSVLGLEDLDLLIMDTYSDMNFEVWRTSTGAPVWIHPGMLRAGSTEAAGLRKVGRATLEDAVDDAVRIIDAVRSKNPGVPVLFLNQPVEYYSKLSGRRAFYKMGELVARERYGVYHCDPLEVSDLEVDDWGSSGPGQTLHFSGRTYYLMMLSAWQRGLADHFDGTTTARDEVRRQARAGRYR